MTDLSSTLADLIRINSVNAFYDNGPGEAEIARYVERFFANRGIETWQQRVIDANGAIEARSNVIARLPGVDSNRRIVLEAHMDTVSVQGMTIPPFEPTVENGLMFGRGSCDTKAGLAGMMHAVAALKEQGTVPPCDVLLAAVVDEEFSFQGVTTLCKELKADAAIVAEPTDLRVAIASKGVLRWRIHAHGKSAHSSKVHLGTNAIYHMARIVLAFEQEHVALAQAPDTLLGPASCNVGKIAGGVQVNFVPDSCVIEIDRRLLPSESVAEVWKHYQNLIDRLKQQVPEMDVRMEEPMLLDEAWTVDPSSAIVLASQNVLKAMGENDQPIGVPFGSDASKLGRAGIPTIIFGPGSIDQAHAAVEYIELQQVARASEFYRRCVLSFDEI
ncbi:MAG: M20 family metallopeptidase [Planctomycetota bacterium]|nr:M20 family metallopeptidase [Planctomycetota bacterium]